MVGPKWQAGVRKDRKASKQDWIVKLSKGEGVRQELEGGRTENVREQDCTVRQSKGKGIRLGGGTVLG